jgi:hypothetical protein
MWLACAALLAWAGEPPQNLFGADSGVKLLLHGYGYLQAGQIEQGVSDPIISGGTITDHLWTEEALLGIGLDQMYRERFRVKVGMEGKLYFSYPMYPVGRVVTKYLRQDFYFTDVNASYALGDPQSPWLRLRTGYFAFNYNPDVRNLGEYLFRSGTYPAYIMTSFDFPAARLLGFGAESDLFGHLHQDLLFTTETYYFPVMNWGMAYLLSARFPFVEIGGGVDFAHLFSVYTPRYSKQFLGDPTTPPLTQNAQYVDGNGDTSYYTFKGTKLMGRVSFDPKAFFNSHLFGPADLKLYSEACLIGAKSYPDSGFMSGNRARIAPSYNNWWEKMPVTFGFNFPAFKVFDVLSVEGEWFGSEYLNDASSVMKNSVPLPVYPSNPAILENKWKWSVYATRSFLDGRFSVTGQVARDHKRVSCADYDSQIWQEMLPEKNDWWWVVKTGWRF